MQCVLWFHESNSQNTAKEIVKGNTEDHLRALITSNDGIISSELTEVFLEMFSLKLALIVGLISRSGPKA